MDTEAMTNIIATKLQEIRQLLIDNGMFKGKYMNMCLINNCISFNNEYWEADYAHPIRYSKEVTDYNG